MRNFFDLTPGSVVIYSNQRFIITNVLDFESVLAKAEDSGELKRLNIVDIKSPLIDIQTKNHRENDLALVKDDDWNKARKRFECIRPILSMEYHTKEDVKNRATEVGVDVSTLYRWIKDYSLTGQISSLIPHKQSGGRGRSRLKKETELIIEETIKDFYLNTQKRSISKTCEEVLRRCRNANVNPPNPNTIRNRISSYSEQIRLRMRQGSEAAKAKFSPHVGIYKDADTPLSIVQIDHTKLDIILVDDQNRNPIGRPWITIGIDVFSRIVCGFCISLDPPNMLSTGLCLAHSILPKEKWLAKYDISTSWPVWGVMKSIHLDNAKEFHGLTLKKVCEEYGINIIWRPVKRPHYGAHIERLLGTFLKEIHTLPGTTFSNIKEKGDYDSTKKAAFTLKELEKWLTTYLTEVYHQKFHSGINASPIKKFEEGILGTAKSPGIGLPDRVLDEEQLYLDFLPFEKRTVQSNGVVLDKIHYYSDVLRKHINETIPDNSRKKRLFIFKRDPRDISVIYFLDPDTKRYVPIPYRDISNPPMSIWELHESIKRIENEGKKNIDEDLIFDAYNKMREQEEIAVKKTMRIRRKKQRRINHIEAMSTVKIRDEILQPNIESPSSRQSDQILPFEEIEMLEEQD